MREAWLFCNGSWISLGRSALSYHLIAHRNATLPVGTVRYWIKNKTKGERPCPPRSISDLWRPVASPRLAIAVIILLRKNFVA